MLDNLIQKLEEKVMTLVVELDEARKEMSRVKHDNSVLRSEKEEQRQKLQSLISLLDTVDTSADRVLSHEYARDVTQA